MGTVDFRSPRAEACFERAMDLAEITSRVSDQLESQDFETLRAIIADLKQLSQTFERQDTFESECG